MWSRQTLLVLVAAATVTAAVTAWRLHSGGREEAAEVGSFPEPVRQLFTEAVQIRRGDTLDTLLEHSGLRRRRTCRRIRFSAGPHRAIAR